MRTILRRILFLAVAAAGLASAAASAAPAKLTPVQLADITAGGIWHGPVPVTPPITRPEPINPGGPILISCTVGIGCITRPYR